MHSQKLGGPNREPHHTPTEVWNVKTNPNKTRSTKTGDEGTK